MLLCALSVSFSLLKASPSPARHLPLALRGSKGPGGALRWRKRPPLFPVCGLWGAAGRGTGQSVPGTRLRLGGDDKGATIICEDKYSECVCMCVCVFY